MRVFVLSTLFVLASAICNPVCQSYCNSSISCFGRPCPDVLGPGEHLAHVFNYSVASISWTMGVDSDQLIICTVLDMFNYRRMLNNLSFTYDYRGPPIDWTCQQGKGGNSMGRGWALVYSCQSRRCDLWHEEVGNLVSDPCSVNCTTGSVGDGVCDPACNVSSCSFDDGDCYETASTHPDQDVNISSQNTNSSSSVRQCYPGCDAHMIGDGICQNVCALSVCNNDGGDCIQDNPCAGDPCINGGTCTQRPGLNLYTCSCVEPYCGPQCQYTLWTDASVSRPTTIFCLERFAECEQAYTSFSMCCFGSVSNCTGVVGTPQGSLGTSTPSPNSGLAHRLF